MLRRWKSVSSRITKKNPWWTYKIDQYQIPGGVSGEYHYVYTQGSSMVIPILDNGNLVLVNQYRYLCDRESVEFPCGGVKPGRTYEEMAALELEEEAGYRSQHLERVAEFNPYNGVTNEICAVFIGRGLQKTVPKPEATEEFEMITCSPTELDDMIREGKIWDGMTLAAWSLVREKIR
ncbi:MAG TPA: NUDIX hydrolase [Bacteroidota bacterium]|nr:NUDIX hydrolase [Bacteroidota bacterium]